MPPIVASRPFLLLLGYWAVDTAHLRKPFRMNPSQGFLRRAARLLPILTIEILRCDLVGQAAKVALGSLPTKLAALKKGGF